MRVIPLFIAVMMIPSCLAQTPTKTEVFSDKDVTSKLAVMAQEAKASGSSGATLGSYKSSAIRLSARTASGGGEMHGRFDDILIVTEGTATLITGGEVVNPKTDKDDETKGPRIDHGTSQTISKGDIVHIPAGTPHQLILAQGDVFQAIVVKTAVAR